jgi:hypothetical protein
MRKYERDKKKNDYQSEAFLILSQQTNNQGIIVELFAFSREQLKKGGSPLSFTHVIGKMHL